MNLTSENTAIVLDSTSDYPDAPARFPNMRFVPLYVRFGDETYRDYVELGPAEFYEKFRVSPVTPATAQPTPQDFMTRVRGARRVRAGLLAARVLEGVGHVPECGARRAGERRRQGARRRHHDRVPRHRDALPRDPAQARTRHHRRGDLRAPRALPCAVRRPLHRRDARVPPARRPHRESPGDRGLAPQPAPGAERGGRRGRRSRTRAREAEGAGRVRAALRRGDDGGTGPPCGHRTRRGRRMGGTLSELAWRVRPNAEIEFTSTLGAVVGTHAGPGAVGFFWFQDTD